MGVTEFEKRAQTNIQLYGQLLATGYSVQEVSQQGSRRVHAGNTVIRQPVSPQVHCP